MDNNGQCCMANECDRARGLAQTIRQQADKYLSVGDVQAGATMIAAARTVLETSGGGMENEVALWVLKTEAAVAQARGSWEMAVNLLQQAQALSVRLFGEAHPFSGILLGSLGEVLLDSCEQKNDPRLAAAACNALARSVDALTAARPQGEYTATYLKSCLSATCCRMEEAQQRLPRRD